MVVPQLCPIPIMTNRILLLYLSICTLWRVTTAQYPEDWYDSVPAYGDLVDDDDYLNNGKYQAVAPLLAGPQEKCAASRGLVRFPQLMNFNCSVANQASRDHCMSDNDCCAGSFCCLSVCDGVTKCFNPVTNEFTNVPPASASERERPAGIGKQENVPRTDIPSSGHLSHEASHKADNRMESSRLGVKAAYNQAMDAAMEHPPVISGREHHQLPENSAKFQEKQGSQIVTVTKSNSSKYQKEHRTNKVKPGKLQEVKSRAMAHEGDQWLSHVHDIPHSGDTTSPLSSKFKSHISSTHNYTNSTIEIISEAHNIILLANHSLFIPTRNPGLVTNAKYSAHGPLETIHSSIQGISFNPPRAPQHTTHINKPLHHPTVPLHQLLSVPHYHSAKGRHHSSRPSSPSENLKHSIPQSEYEPFETPYHLTNTTSTVHPGRSHPENAHMISANILNNHTSLSPHRDPPSIHNPTHSEYRVTHPAAHSLPPINQEGQHILRPGTSSALHLSSSATRPNAGNSATSSSSSLQHPVRNLNHSGSFANTSASQSFQHLNSSSHLELNSVDQIGRKVHVQNHSTHRENHSSISISPSNHSDIHAHLSRSSAHSTPHYTLTNVLSHNGRHPTLSHLITHSPAHPEYHMAHNNTVEHDKGPTYNHEKFQPYRGTSKYPHPTQPLHNQTQPHSSSRFTSHVENAKDAQEESDSDETTPQINFGNKSNLTPRPFKKGLYGADLQNPIKSDKNSRSLGGSSIEGPLKSIESSEDNDFDSKSAGEGSDNSSILRNPPKNSLKINKDTNPTNEDLSRSSSEGQENIGHKMVDTNRLFVGGFLDEEAEEELAVPIKSGVRSTNRGVESNGNYASPTPVARWLTKQSRTSAISSKLSDTKKIVQDLSASKQSQMLILSSSAAVQHTMTESTRMPSTEKPMDFIFQEDILSNVAQTGESPLFLQEDFGTMPPLDEAFWVSKVPNDSTASTQATQTPKINASLSTIMNSAGINPETTNVRKLQKVLNSQDTQGIHSTSSTAPTTNYERPRPAIAIFSNRSAQTSSKDSSTIISQQTAVKKQNTIILPFLHNNTIEATKLFSVDSKVTIDALATPERIYQGDVNADGPVGLSNSYSDNQSFSVSVTSELTTNRPTLNSRYRSSASPPEPETSPSATIVHKSTSEQVRRPSEINGKVTVASNAAKIAEETRERSTSQSPSHGNSYSTGKTSKERASWTILEGVLKGTGPATEKDILPQLKLPGRKQQVGVKEDRSILSPEDQVSVMSVSPTESTLTPSRVNSDQNMVSVAASLTTSVAKYVTVSVQDNIQEPTRHLKSTRLEEMIHGSDPSKPDSLLVLSLSPYRRSMDSPEHSQHTALQVFTTNNVPQSSSKYSSATTNLSTASPAGFKVVTGTVTNTTAVDIQHGRHSNESSQAVTIRNPDVSVTTGSVQVDPTTTVLQYLAEFTPDLPLEIDPEVLIEESRRKGFTAASDDSVQFTYASALEVDPEALVEESRRNAIRDYSTQFATDAAPEIDPEVLIEESGKNFIYAASEYPMKNGTDSVLEVDSEALMEEFIKNTINQSIEASKNAIKVSAMLGTPNNTTELTLASALAGDGNLEDRTENTNSSDTSLKNAQAEVDQFSGFSNWEVDSDINPQNESDALDEITTIKNVPLSTDASNVDSSLQLGVTNAMLKNNTASTNSDSNYHRNHEESSQQPTANPNEDQEQHQAAADTSNSHHRPPRHDIPNRPSETPLLSIHNVYVINNHGRHKVPHHHHGLLATHLGDALAIHPAGAGHHEVSREVTTGGGLQPSQHQGKTTHIANAENALPRAVEHQEKTIAFIETKTKSVVQMSTVTGAPNVIDVDEGTNFIDTNLPPNAEDNH